MKTGALATVAFLATSSLGLADENNRQMRLLDDLDFPGEGYCIDVPGVGLTARTDLPLVLHNCLPSRNSVDRVAEERDGRIYMPAYDACVTAFGVMSVLPGVPVMLRECGTNESFLLSDQFQKFDRTADNQLRLRGTQYCLTGGVQADRTFSAEHRWRTLTLEECTIAPLALSVWK
ncbi:RICIN domain-containing protein [uncultured Tateyamaria sp.]|uniref:RICIN domain-containing protein n=1 Tax=uncultured Tateyamaria sp. TaxID=455651 RepID=UPI00262B3A8D|nr:RICIN domain-containing protein [uncultured Tateyamaria sp.]